jgi:hypothetical protein
VLRWLSAPLVGVSGGGGFSSAFSVYKACSLRPMLRWFAQLLPAGRGGEGVELELAVVVLVLDVGGAALPSGVLAHHRKVASVGSSRLPWWQSRRAFLR